MKEEHLMAEDSFEKARKTFFGSAQETVKPSPPELIKPRVEKGRDTSAFLELLPGIFDNSFV
jgi:hypothetical protein